MKLQQVTEAANIIVQATKKLEYVSPVRFAEAAEGISEGDRVEADLHNGIIRNLTTRKEYKTEPFPEFVQKIIENGGLMQSISNGTF